MRTPVENASAEKAVRVNRAREDHGQRATTNPHGPWVYGTELFLFAQLHCPPFDDVRAASLLRMTHTGSVASS